MYRHPWLLKGSSNRLLSFSSMVSVVGLIEIPPSGFRRRDDADVLVAIVFCVILLRTEDVLSPSDGLE